MSGCELDVTGAAEATKSTERYTKRPLQHLLQASGDPRLIICFIFCVEDTSDLLEGAWVSLFTALLKCFYFHNKWQALRFISAVQVYVQQYQARLTLLANDVILYMATEKWNPEEKTSCKRLLADPVISKQLQFNNMLNMEWLLFKFTWKVKCLISKGQFQLQRKLQAFDSHSNALWTICLTLQISLVVKLWAA